MNISKEELVQLFKLSKDFCGSTIYGITDLDLLKQLYDNFCEDDEIASYMRDTIEYHISYLQCSSKGLFHNRPFNELLPKIKGSNPDSDAVREVKRRFNGLEYSEQIQVMTIFLNHGSSYHRWCYTKLTEWCEPSFGDKLISLWQEKKGALCRSALISILSEDKMKGIIDTILDNISRYDLLILIKRFGKASWFPSIKDKLKDLCDYNKYNFDHSTKDSLKSWYFYFYGISMTNETISKEECGAMLYRYLQLRRKSYFRYTPNHYMFEEIYDHICYFDLTGELDKHNPSLKAYLKCIYRMGHHDVVMGFISWMLSINKLLPPFSLSDNADDYNRRVYKQYCELLFQNMPIDFVGIENTPLCTRDELVNHRCEEYNKSVIDSSPEFWETMAFIDTPAPF